MRLLFVHQRFGAFGGAETNILQTAEGLEQLGCSSALVYGESTGRCTDAWQRIFEPCLQVPSVDKPAWVEETLKEVSPDIIYLNTFTDLTVLEALVNSGRPVIRRVHDHELYCMRSYKYNYFTRKPCTRAASLYCVFPCLGNITRNAAGSFPIRLQSYREKQRELALNRRCDRFIVYSEYCRQELVRNGFDPARIHIHRPIRSASDGTSTFGPRNLLLFAGQVIRGKGVDALLRALAQVESDFECIILGDGNHRPTCERLAARLGLTGKVRFAGYVPPDEVQLYYADASVFLVSSLWPEPLGMTGPEAMMYGLPVVAFDAGGIREWLHDGENGFLVPWNDTRAFARRIDQLLRDKALARSLGSRARQLARAEFNPDHQTGRLLEVFRQVCPERSSRSNPLPALAANPF